MQKDTDELGAEYLEQSTKSLFLTLSNLMKMQNSSKYNKYHNFYVKSLLKVVNASNSPTVASPELQTTEF